MFRRSLSRLARVRPLAAVAAVSASLSLSLAPAQSYLLYERNGPASLTRFGEAAVVLGDVNGDGAKDIAVGTPTFSGNGRVIVLSGADGTPLLAWSGAQPGEAFTAFNVQRLGATLAARASAWGTRLVAGAPATDIGFGFGGTTDAGAAALLWIAAAQESRGLPSALFPEEYGSTVASIGDVNGDLFSDYLVGAPRFAPGGITIGRCAVISGRNGAQLREHVGALPNSSSFGATACGLGDVDADGVPDYAIGDPADTTQGALAGRVKIFSGASGALLRTLSGAAGDFFGGALCAAGISSALNASGNPCIAIGAPRADLSGGRQDAGYVKVFNATNGAPVFTFEGENPSDFCGFSLCIGNSPRGTNSSSPDLLVGCPGAVAGGFPRAGIVRRFSLSNGGAEQTPLVDPDASLGHSFGFSLASARFDSNTAGGYDVVVGAPGNGRVNGNAYGFSGAGALRFTLTGVVQFGRFGAAAAYAGDIDGDDRPDFAVGAPAATGSRGEVRFFSGANGQALPGTILGEGAQRLGTSLAGVGDPLDADLCACGLVMGFPGGDFARTTATCVPRLVFTDSPNTPRVPSTNGGAAVAFIGDLNQDSVEDFAVAAPNESLSGQASVGRVTLFSGANATVLGNRDGVDGGDRFGTAICGAGDVNADGIPDLAVGATGTDVPLLNRNDVGTVSFLHGATGAVLRSAGGLESGERLGSALVALGDVNGDGTPDVAAGAPGFDGLLGNDIGRVRLLSGATAGSLRTINGASDNDVFGAVLASGADANGDGVNDLLVGVPFSDLSATLVNTGRAQLYSGASGALLESFFGGTTAGENVGFAVALGDVNRDCFPDLVIGVPGRNQGKIRVLSRLGFGTHSRGFGFGCPGSNGITPHASTIGGTPFSGGSPGFGLALTCALGGAPAVLQLGFSSTSWNGVPLPIDLDLLGFSGCSLFVAADIASTVFTTGTGPGAGTVIFPLPIPNDSGLSGFVFFGQWMIVDAGAPNGLLAMSPAVRVEVQQIP